MICANSLSKRYIWMELIAPAPGAWIAPVGESFQEVDRICITDAQTEVRAGVILTDIASILPDRSVLNLKMDAMRIPRGFLDIITESMSGITSLSGRVNGLWSRGAVSTLNIFETIRAQTEGTGKRFSLIGASINVYVCSGHAPGLIHFADDIWRTIGDNQPVTLDAGEYDYDDIASLRFSGRITSARVRNADMAFTAESNDARLSENIATTIGTSTEDSNANTVPIVIGRMVPELGDAQALVPMVSSEFVRSSIIFRYADEVEADAATEVFFKESNGILGRVRDLTYQQALLGVLFFPFPVLQNNAIDLGKGSVAISATGLTTTALQTRLPGSDFVMLPAEQSALLPEVDKAAKDRDQDIAHEPPIISAGRELIRLIGNGDYPRAAQFTVGATGTVSETPYIDVPHERAFGGTSRGGMFAGSVMRRVNGQGNNGGTIVLWRTAPDYIREFYNRRAATNPFAEFGNPNHQKHAGISGSVARLLEHSRALAEFGTTPPSGQGLIFSALDVGPEYLSDGVTVNPNKRWASRLWTVGYPGGTGRDHWFGNGDGVFPKSTFPSDFCDGRFLLLCPPPKIDAGELANVIRSVPTGLDIDTLWGDVGFARINVRGRLRIRRPTGEVAPNPGSGPDPVARTAFARVAIVAPPNTGRAVAASLYIYSAPNPVDQLAYLEGDGVSDLLEFDQTRFLRVPGLSVSALYESIRRDDGEFTGLIAGNHPIPAALEIETNAVYPGGAWQNDGFPNGPKKHTPGSGIVSPEVEIDSIVIEFVSRKQFERGDLYCPAVGLGGALHEGTASKLSRAALKVAQRRLPSASLLSIGGAPTDTAIGTILAQGYVQDPQANPRKIIRDIAQNSWLRFHAEGNSLYVTSLIDTVSRTVDRTIEIDDLRTGADGLTEIAYNSTDQRDLITGVELRYRHTVDGKPGRMIRITHDTVSGDDGRSVDLSAFGVSDTIPTLSMPRGTVDFIQSLFLSAYQARGSENVLITQDTFVRLTGEASNRILGLARLRANELLTLEITAPMNCWLFNGLLETYELGESIRGSVPDRIVDHQDGGKRRFLAYALDDEIDKSPVTVLRLQELPK